MKTSLDLPDDLYRQVKSKSALEGRAVREVATALFSAWVQGRVSADAVDATNTASEPEPEPTDAHQQWLARWRMLSADVSAATEGPSGLVDDLQRSRR